MSQNFHKIEAVRLEAVSLNAFYKFFFYAFPKCNIN